jgi:hypothetical protein
MSSVHVVRSTLYLPMIAAVLCTCSATLGTISFTNNTLTYSSPSDLSTTIDPPGLYDVQASYGVTKADFQALSPQVVGFNGAPAPGTPLNALVANYSTSGTVTFTFATSYNYGSYTSYGRGGFSGSVYQDAISTAPNTVDGITNWFDATITTTDGQGVRALGLCATFRNDQAVDAGQAVFTLSDGTTAAVNLPALGGANTRHVFIGYQAPAGKTITRVQASRTSTVGGAWVSVDDLSFVMGNTISFTNNTLTYGSPSDLVTIIDPAGLYDVQASYGVTKAGFQALNPQVVAFNGAPAPGTPLNALVANNTASGSVTFTFGVSYNYGSYTSYGRGGFSGSVYQDAISTAPNTVNGITDWFDATIATTGGQGVTALGFCATFRNDQAVDAGQAVFTLSDGTTGTVSLPALGGANTRHVFIGYQAPTGKTITRVQASRTSTVGGAWVSVDDLSFLTASTVGDTTAPAAVSNLATSSPTGSSITLSWTAPGDDGSTGTATTYDIRYSTSAITDANWGSATQVTGEPAPAAAGTAQNMTVSGLTSDTTYHFALKTSDEVPNVSALSNVPSGRTSDVTAPAAVTNLAASSPTGSSVALSWTAPGDSGTAGTATTYDIRYSTSAITDGNWGSATQVTGEPAPAAAGTAQNMTVSGLTSDTTYYFAIKTADEVPNWSGLSNVPSGRTSDVTAPAAVTNLATSGATASSITLTWTAPGDSGTTGTATTYDIRYSTATISDANWGSATQVTGEPVPAVAGTAQNMTVSGLSAGTTYYFGIKTADEVPNWSGLSNVPSGTTTPPTDANITTANSYDDAWESGSDGWVQHCKNLRSSWVGKTDGFVIHIGDSITYANPYGAWARYGSGKTTADNDICNWMRAGVWGDGTNNSTNGWYLAAYDVSGRNGSFTAKSGLRADHYIAGNYSLPSVDHMFTPNFTNPDGRQYRDAQICILMLGTNDAGASRTAAAVAADLDRIVRWLEAADVIVALSTLPPRNGMDSTIQAYNTEIRNLAQRKRIPLIDCYQEIVRRRPNGTWMGTLISSDGVHPSADYNGSTASSDPYANNGAALSNSGYLLRDWLSVQKIQEIKTKAYTTATTWNVSTAAALQSAVASYAAGDTIVVAAGTYYPSNRLYFNRGGATIRGATGNRADVVISGPGMTVYQEPLEMMDVISDDVTIKDLTIQNVYHHAIHMRGENDTDRTRIQNVRTLNCGERHLKGSYNSGTPQYVQDDILIENCLLEQTQANSNHADNDYIGGLDTMGVTNLVMRDCVVRGIKGPAGGGRAGIFIWHTNTNPTIERNRIFDCDRGISLGNPGWAGPGPASTGGILRNNMITRGVNIGLELCFTDDMKVYHNTVYSADASYFRTVHIFDSSSIDTINGLDLRYNIIRGQIYRNYTGSVSETGNITGSTPATNWFVDPSNTSGNLHLTSYATGAFNNAAPLTEVMSDFDKQTRSSTPDTGADEY